MLFLEGKSELLNDEMNTMKLSKLLHSDSHLIVDNRSFRLFLSLAGYPLSDLLHNILDALNNDVLQFFSCPAFLSSPLLSSQVSHLSKILQTVRRGLSFGDISSVPFENILGCLKVHDSVLSFVCIVRGKLVEKLGHS